MIYGLLLIIIILLSYIVWLHLKMSETSDIECENNILATPENSSQKQSYYLKFNIDKDNKITEVNNDMLMYGNFKSANLINKDVVGLLLENSISNQEFLSESWKLLKKKKKIITSEQIFLKSDGTKIPVLLRIRPILNELLICKGISFWGYPLNKQLKLEKQLKNIQDKDAVIGEILNAEAFYQYLDEQVKISNRYNRPLLLISIELSDVYNFVNKGFSYDKGDKILRLASDACIESVGNIAKIGRYDTTKLGIILNETDAQKIKELTQIIWERVIDKIRKLNVDKVNASMINIFYIRRRGFDDSAENMLARSRKYLKNSLLIHRYGISSLDKVN